MICSSLFPPIIHLNAGESKIDFISYVVIMLLCYLSQFMVYKSIKTFVYMHTSSLVRTKKCI